jgi:hypothetical protein
MANTIAPLRASRGQGDPARHREPVDDDLSATRRPGYGPAHVRLADRYIQARALGDAVGLLDAAGRRRSPGHDARPSRRTAATHGRREQPRHRCFSTHAGATWEPLARWWTLVLVQRRRLEGQSERSRNRAGSESARTVELGHSEHHASRTHSQSHSPGHGASPPPARLRPWDVGRTWREARTSPPIGVQRRAVLFRGLARAHAQVNDRCAARKARLGSIADSDAASTRARDHLPGL